MIMGRPFLAYTQYGMGRKGVCSQLLDLEIVVDCTEYDACRCAQTLRKLVHCQLFLSISSSLPRAHSPQSAARRGPPSQDSDKVGLHANFILF